MSCGDHSPCSDKNTCRHGPTGCGGYMEGFPTGSYNYCSSLVGCTHRPGASTQPPTDHKAQQQQPLLSHLEWEACMYAVPGANWAIGSSSEYCILQCMTVLSERYTYIQFYSYVCSTCSKAKTLTINRVHLHPVQQYIYCSCNYWKWQLFNPYMWYRGW